MVRTKRYWQPRNRFLREFAKTCCVAAAARAAGISRRTVYRWRDSEPDFRRRWDTAAARGAERLREEAMERALVGREQPVWHQGRIVGHVRGTDNHLLWRLAQGHHSDVYGPQAVEIQAERERTAEFNRRLDAAERRAAAYEAELRAEAEARRAARPANTDDGE